MVEQTRVGMPLAEFIRLFDEEGPFELINGERKPLMPTVAGHSKTVRALFLALYLYISSKLMGDVFSETTFILPGTYDSNWVEGSRTPDVMYYAPERLATYEAENPDWRERPYSLVPDLVAEIVSPNDKISEMDAKVDQYLADGVRMVWLIDPQRRKAVVYAPDLEQPLHLAGDDLLDGQDVIPGFQTPLSRLFE
jgi:Uma2 family endonuclease